MTSTTEENNKESREWYLFIAWFLIGFLTAVMIFLGAGCEPRVPEHCSDGIPSQYTSTCVHPNHVLVVEDHVAVCRCE